MVTIDVDAQSRVRLSASVHVPLRASLVWGRMRDFAWFTALDPFHHRMRVLASMPEVGAPLVIVHSFLGVRLERVGRILQWAEGEGYSFSDLSARGVRTGFPHVYCYHVRALDESSCCVLVSVRGRWTAGWMPRWLIRAWLRFVMTQVASRIQLAMFAHRFRLHRRGLI